MSDTVDSLLTELESQEIHADQAQRTSWLAFWAACVVPTLPFLVVYLVGELGSLEYFYVPLVFLLVGVLGWLRHESGLSRPGGRMVWFFVGLSFFSVFLAIVLNYAWLGAFGFVVAVGACLSSIRGTLRLSLVALTAPLLSLLKLPLQLDRSLVGWIHRQVAEIASVFLDLFSITHATSGSVIQLLEDEVLVSDVTSGLLNVSFLIFVSFSILAWKRMSLWLLPLYGLAAIATSIFVDTIRVIAQVTAVGSFSLDTNTYWFAPVMTTLGMLISVACLLSFHHLFATLFHFVEPAMDADINPILQLWNRFSVMDEPRAVEEMSLQQSRSSAHAAGSISTWLMRGTVALACFLVVGSLVQVVRGVAVGDPLQDIALKPLLIPDEDFFAQTTAAVKLLEFEEDDGSELLGAGTRSDVWQGVVSNAAVTVQVTQPFTYWVEVTRAYERLGWQLLDRDRVAPANEARERNDLSETGDEEESEGSRDYVRARLRSTGDGGDASLEGYLFFSAIKSGGKIVEPPDLFSDFLRRVKSRLGYQADGSREASVVIQMWAVSSEKLSADELRLLRESFLAYRDQLVGSLSGNPSRVSPEEGMEANE